jgi:hypothetical protein
MGRPPLRLVDGCLCFCSRSWALLFWDGQRIFSKPGHVAHDAQAHLPGTPQKEADWVVQTGLLELCIAISFFFPFSPQGSWRWAGLRGSSSHYEERHLEGMDGGVHLACWTGATAAI